jgi:hypothetical protein
VTLSARDADGRPMMTIDGLSTNNLERGQPLALPAKIAPQLRFPIDQFRPLL